MFAVIETGGKQYKVSPGQKIKIDPPSPPPSAKASEGKKATEGKENFAFDRVLFKGDNENITIGAPYIPNAVVEAKILRNGRHDKVIVFKYSSKTRYKKKKGHRQPFTEVEIVSIK